LLLCGESFLGIFECLLLSILGGFIGSQGLQDVLELESLGLSTSLWKCGQLFLIGLDLGSHSLLVECGLFGSLSGGSEGSLFGGFLLGSGVGLLLC
jgi:hypothetical protein